MNGRTLLARIGIVLVIAVGLLGFASVAAASPIIPKVERVVTPRPEPITPFTPARAGWNGPEGKSVPNPTLESLRPKVSKRQARGALLAAFIPDVRILALILLVILLLRRIRKNAASPEQPARPLPDESSVDVKRAA